MDLDNVFAYSTPRFVKIRDRRLGMLNTLFKFFIFVYVVVYNVILLMGYKVQGDVVGTARLQPRAPDLKYLRNSSRHRYCMIDGKNRTYTSSDGLIPDLPAFECRYLDTFDTVYPPVEAQALFISTRVNDTLQQLPPNCTDLPRPSCRYETTSVETYFVPGTELVTLLIDHTMSVPSLDFSKSSLDMTGRIEYTNGTEVNPCDAYTRRGYLCPTFANGAGFEITFGTQDAADIIALDTLFQAADVRSLDERAGNIGKFTSETFRYAGIVLIVTVNYDNYFSYDENKVQYILTSKLVPDADFKAEEINPGPGIDETTRRIIDRHGVRIVITQGGKIGRFAVSQLLIVLVTSMGLLAVSSSIVDGVAMNVLKMRHIYAQYRTVTSVDFSDIAAIKQSDLNRFVAEDLVNPRPAIFEQVGQGAGGVTSGEGQPRQMTSAPAPAKQAGYYGGMGPASGLVDEVDDVDSDEGSGTTGTSVRSPEIVAWGENPAAASSAPSVRMKGWKRGFPSSAAV
ncbi:hypothetical protein FNF29_05775 [Cafeteria roenbergensis]|uniref:Uncharacterized protein n=1 Tax=Cafeteria roenbergensis TaxID=33653 RepID=A0A5A8CA31_CAFRO|nr:hypothetical protein FNF29_05775 [Cafeteria roenbergensis]|eukprot:KAA0149765.1 hypothetical protein FNF29_05775 [Cafeteria roenbergensis]